MATPTALSSQLRTTPLMPASKLSSARLPSRAIQPRAARVSCVLASPSPADVSAGQIAGNVLRPDSLGRFGRFGGKYVSEALMQALKELEAAYRSLSADEDFQRELSGILKDYVGRETPLYFAERLTDHYRRRRLNANGVVTSAGGPDIYLKREVINCCF